MKLKAVGWYCPKCKQFKWSKKKDYCGCYKGSRYEKETGSIKKIQKNWQRVYVKQEK